MRRAPHDEGPFVKEAYLEAFRVRLDHRNSRPPATRPIPASSIGPEPEPV